MVNDKLMILTIGLSCVCINLYGGKPYMSKKSLVETILRVALNGYNIFR